MARVSHTALWDSVCKTDPAHTKTFKKGGGFSGTAIKPYWLVRRATETFGPVGIGWGWSEIENKMVAGVWCSKICLWYLEPDVANPRRGEMEQWGQTQMEGTNKNGPFVDEEAPKKAVTDAVTKCLSYLGFAGDVHMGLFDDTKYVEDMRHEFGEKPKGVFDTPELRTQYVGNCIEAISKTENAVDLRTQKECNLAKWNAMKASADPADVEALNAIIAAYNPVFAKFKEMAAKTAEQKPATVEGAKRQLPPSVASDEIPF